MNVQLLLAGVGKGWASRVFYSDNGSTAIEVGIKMAFRKYIVDNDLAKLAEGADGVSCWQQPGFQTASWVFIREGPELLAEE